MSNFELKPTLYVDPDLERLHNPNNGSLENGQRVKIDLSKYHFCNIVYPQRSSKYFNLVKNSNDNNPVINYLLKHFDTSVIKRIFGFRFNLAFRNCHGCTTYINSLICPVCKTRISKKRYYKYAYLIDNTIADFDTTYITTSTLAAVKSSVSMVCKMIDDILKNKTLCGFAIVRPPGHHASFNKSEGFCIVNNIAIAANYYLSINKSDRIFILDIDAHHGNGTQDIFYESSNVYYCSIHSRNTFPNTGSCFEKGKGQGEGFNLNITVENGIDHNDYLNIIEYTVVPVIKNYDPNLILLSMGFDGLSTDPMKLMNLLPITYGSIVRTMKSFNKPVGIVLEGGYDLDNLQKCFDEVIQSMIY